MFTARQDSSNALLFLLFPHFFFPFFHFATLKNKTNKTKHLQQPPYFYKFDVVVDVCVSAYYRFILDARLTSAGNTAASVHHQPLVDTNPTLSPETTQPSRIPVSVLSDRRSNLSRSVSESMPASRLPVPVKASGAGGGQGQHHTLSRFMSADQSTDVQQQETSSYSVRKQFWEEVASASSSTSSISSATGSTGAGSSRREVRQTKSERSSLVVTDESFSATSGDIGDLQPQQQRQTSTSQRSSAILSEEEDIYESERGVYTSVTKTSTSEMLETSHQVAEEQESGKLVVAQQEREQIETVQVTTERTGETADLGSASSAMEGETEVTVTGSSQRHRQRIGLEEYVYSSGDESVSMRAEDVESESGVVLPCGRQLVTEQFVRSSKTVYKDGQPVFVEQSSSGSQHPQPDEQLQQSTPSVQSDSFEETPPTSTVGHGDSVEVNVGSLEQLPADVSVAVATASTSDSEPEQEEMAFVNTGFIGVDHIDTVESSSSIAARSVSPFEVPREEAYVIGTFEPPEYEDDVPVEQLRRGDSFDSRDLEAYGGATDAEGFGAPELEHEPEYERRLTPQEALLIAENIIEEIKAEAPRRAEMMSEQTAAAAAAAAARAEEHSSSSATAFEQTESYITEYMQQLPSDSGQEEEMDEPVFSANQQKGTLDTGRRESSFDITDEELRSSFSAADMTPPMVAADQQEEEAQVQLDAVDRTLSQVREHLELDQVAEEMAEDPAVVAASATSPPALFSPERETMSTTSSGSRLDSASVGFDTKREETEETLYYSAVGSTGAASGQQSSRPTSSDVEALLSAGTTVGSSEYETAFSPSSSSHSAVTMSGDFHSAISSVSSRDSMKSLDSSATDASETLMASAVEHQHPDDCDLTPTTDASLDLNQMNEEDEQQQQFLLHADEEGPESPFEMVSAEMPVDEGLAEVIEDDEDGEPGTPRMKRSQEMTFHPEPKPLRSGEPSSPPATPTPSEESPCLVETTGPNLFDYVTAANFSTSTMGSDDTGSTPSTVVEAEKPVDEQPLSQPLQEEEMTTHHDVSTITSRSSSLASATDVTITSSSIARRESCPEQTMSTQITTRRAPSEPLPNITVQHASPISNERRFSYPAETEVAPVVTNVIEEVPSDQEEEEEEEGCGFVAGDQADDDEAQQENEEIEADIDYPEVEVEDLQSPPGLVAKRIDPPLMAGYNYEMSFERGEDEELDEELRPVEAEEDVELTEEDLEKQKRWMEMQFEEAEDAAEEVFGQLPPRSVQLLADIEEGREDEESLNGSDRSGLAGRLKESSLSSTPEFDVLSGRRYFSRNAAGGATGGNGGEDVMSVDSLQDFERLEQELQAVKLRRQSNGSQESLNGSGKRVGGDNVSVNSLTEFERLERDMAEAAKIEERARQQEAALLSEIEEGHESQQSESSDSCETLSGGGLRRGGDDTDGDDSDDEDYEQRMFEIDEIIRQAQTNIEQFDTDLAVQGQQETTTTQHHSMVRFESTSSAAEGMTRSSIMDSDSMDSIEPDLVMGASSGGGSASASRTAATYRTYIRTTEVKYGSEEQQPDSLTGAPDSLEVFGPSSVDSLDSASNAGRSRSGPHDSDSIAAMAGAQSSSNSSSAREELPRDLIQRSSVPSHKMATSSDSLEATGSSSTGFTSDSIMSGSMTSSSGGSAAAAAGAPGPLYSETSRTVEMNPEIRKVTFRGTDVDEQMKDFVSRFAPGEDIREVEVTDPRTGSIFVTRLVQRRTVVDASELPSASGEPDDLPSIQALEEYIRARGPQLEHVDSFEMDDGMGNVQRVIRKRVVAQSADGSSFTDSTLPPNAPSLAYPQYPKQVTQPVESTPLPELTSSGAGRALCSVFTKKPDPLLIRAKSSTPS